MQTNASELHRSPKPTTTVGQKLICNRVWSSLSDDASGLPEDIQESLADAKVSVRQQCVYEKGP